MPMTSYLRKKLGDHALGKAAYTMPTTVSLALFTASPGDSGSFTNEVSGGSYARVELTSLMGSFVLATGIATNASAIDFAAPTATWGVITYVGVVDDLSPVNLILYEAVPSPRTVLSGGRRVSFAIGALQIRFT